MGHPVPPVEPDPIGEPCTNCVGDTPAIIKITFSGVNGCQECYFGQKQSGSIDGSYVLNQSFDSPCIWGYDEFSGVFGVYTRYNEPNCTDDIDYQYDMVILEVRVMRSATKIRIDAAVWDIGKNQRSLAFYNDFITGADCVFDTIPNLLVDCPQSNEYYGGNAVISAV